MASWLEEAATDLYASRWKAFRHVTLPQIAPGVAGGALLALTLSLDDDVVTQFAPGPGATTLPVYVWGTTGIVVDTAVVGDDVPRTWGLIFDPAIADEYSG